MKALIQLVKDCTLTIDYSNTPYSHIDKGLLIFLGVKSGDSENDAIKLAKKIAGLRIFEDENGKMNLSCTDEKVNGKFLVVSQFTLCADCSHGRRPDFFNAARPDVAEPLYEFFKEKLKEEAVKLGAKPDSLIESGKFGADMQISFTNLGPVTFIIESDELK